jgi:hypothetical protein
MINVISTGPQNGLEIKNRYLDKFRDMPREDAVAIFLTSRHDKFVEGIYINGMSLVLMSKSLIKIFFTIFYHQSIDSMKK